jgi:hypothetical protein
MILAEQFLEEMRESLEDTAVEVFGSVEEFITAYNKSIEE